MGATVDLGKIPELFGEVEGRWQTAITKALQMGGAFLENQIKPVTPYKTGRLRASVGFQMTTPSLLEVGVLFPKDGKVLIYAPFIEFGTRYIEPRLYVTGTFDRNRDRVSETIRDSILKAINA